MDTTVALPGILFDEENAVFIGGYVNDVFTGIMKTNKPFGALFQEGTDFNSVCAGSIAYQICLIIANFVPEAVMEYCDEKHPPSFFEKYDGYHAFFKSACGTGFKLVLDSIEENTCGLLDMEHAPNPDIYFDILLFLQWLTWYYANRLFGHLRVLREGENLHFDESTLHDIFAISEPYFCFLPERNTV